MKLIDYSVVVPVFNSEPMLTALFERTKAVFEAMGAAFEMIFVDDYSQDGSWQVIMRLKEAHPQQVKAIRLAINCGQQKATLCGINHHAGRMVLTIDDDLQIPPEEMVKLIENYHYKPADLVYGIFDSKRHSWARTLGSLIFNKMFALLASTSGQGTSFRLMTHQLAERLANINQKHLLLDEVLHWFTYNISYVQVRHEERVGGESGYTFPKLVMISLRYVIYYTVIPLRVMTFLGFASSLVSFIVGLVYIYGWLMTDVPIGFTSIIVAISFSTSIILFSLGIIGEYISRFYVLEYNRPSYVIKEIY